MTNRPPQFPDDHSPQPEEIIDAVPADHSVEHGAPQHSNHADPSQYYHGNHPQHYPNQPHPNQTHPNQPQAYYPQPVPQQPQPAPAPEKPRRRYEDMAMGALAVFGLQHIKERISGCVFAAIGMPLFILFFGGFVFFSMKSSNDRRAERNQERAQEKLNEEISRTEKSLQSASDRVQREARRLRRLPHDDEGSRLMIGFRDGWRSDLHYEIVDESNYLIRSNGPDCKHGTDDDIVTKKSVSVSAQGLPGESTKTVAEAPAPTFDINALSPETRKVVSSLVDSTSHSQSSEALQQLAAAEPVDADREQVVSVVIHYTHDLRLARSAAQVVRNWATPKQAQLIADFVLDGGIRGTTATDELVQTLVELKDTDAMLRLINHPRTSVSQAALQHVKAWGVDDNTLAQQHLDDVKTLTVGSQTWLAAIEQLKSLPITDEHISKEINASLIPLTAENPSRMAGVYEILKKTITPDDLEALLVYRSRQNESELVTILSEMTDPLAYQTLVEIGLESNNERALTVLRAGIGADAESYVWPYLEDSNSFRKKQAVDLLATIGTTESLSRLEDLAANDRFVMNEAKIAIRLIKKRTEGKD